LPPSSGHSPLRGHEGSTECGQAHISRREVEGRIDKEQRATASTTHPPPPSNRGGLLRPANPILKTAETTRQRDERRIRARRVGLGPCDRNAPVVVCVGCEDGNSQKMFVSSDLPKGDNFSPTFYKNALKNRKTTACAHSMQLACLHTHLLAWPVVLKRICNGGQP
jgi:hypothetical protein